MQAALTNLLLPPLGLVLLALLAGLATWRRALHTAILVVLSTGLLLFLATPFAAGHLRAGLVSPPAATAAVPGAIVILGAEQRRTASGYEPGPLTLERLRAGAALARATGLPLLVTGGPLSADAPPIAELMAASLAGDFRISAHWIEPSARDTRGNAEATAMVLRPETITTIHLVTHAWHLPRAMAAFRRAGLTPLPAPVRIERAPDGILADFLPRPDHLAESWLMLREWAGILVYRLRDGPAAPATPRQ